MNVLFVQDSSPCIRNIKYAEALQQMGVNVHLLHRGKPHRRLMGLEMNSISRYQELQTIVQKLSRR